MRKAERHSEVDDDEAVSDVDLAPYGDEPDHIIDFLHHALLRLFNQLRQRRHGDHLVAVQQRLQGEQIVDH